MLSRQTGPLCFLAKLEGACWTQPGGAGERARGHRARGPGSRGDGLGNSLHSQSSEDQVTGAFTGHQAQRPPHACGAFSGLINNTPLFSSPAQVQLSNTAQNTDHGGPVTSSSPVLLGTGLWSTRPLAPSRCHPPVSPAATHLRDTVGQQRSHAYPGQRADQRQWGWSVGEGVSLTAPLPPKPITGHKPPRVWEKGRGCRSGEVSPRASQGPGRRGSPCTTARSRRL